MQGPLHIWVEELLGMTKLGLSLPIFDVLFTPGTNRIMENKKVILQRENGQPDVMGQLTKVCLVEAKWIRFLVAWAPGVESLSQYSQSQYISVIVAPAKWCTIPIPIRLIHTMVPSIFPNLIGNLLNAEECATYCGP